MSSPNLKHVPKSEWKTAEVQPSSGSIKERLQILYVLLIPAVIIGVGSFNFPVNLRLYVQIVDTVFVMLLAILGLLLTIRSYSLQKKEEALGYTTWKQPKKNKK